MDSTGPCEKVICKIEKVVSSHLVQKCVSQQRWKDNAFSLKLQCLNSMKCFSFGALYGNFLENIPSRQFMSLERSKRRVLPEPRQELPEVTNARFVSSRSQSPTVCLFVFICQNTNARLVCSRPQRFCQRKKETLLTSQDGSWCRGSSF